GGMTRDQIRKLIAPEGKLPAPSKDARAEIDKLVAARKREIIERECFGLIEFVTPQHGFDVVGGMEEVKKDLLQVADNIRNGRRNRVPMGILFTGPMGTGKTFVAEAFARECGLTTIKLKNFRSKWVGATEGNLEKILNVIRAIGQVVVIVDEGDRAFGNTDGDGDGGTSSRVIARIKEFMSDTSNRGRILFLVRPIVPTSSTSISSAPDDSTARSRFCIRRRRRRSRTSRVQSCGRIASTPPSTSAPFATR